MHLAARRVKHLSKGQRAMALAFAYPEPAKLKRKGSSVSKEQRRGLSEAPLSQAHLVLAHSREMAGQVIALAPRPAAAMARSRGRSTCPAGLGRSGPAFA